jgi:PAS domain S-box-containing protein
VITITRGGRVVDMNSGAERMFGVRPPAVMHRPVAELLALADMRALEAPEFGTALSQDPSRLLDRELEVTASRHDGRAFTAELMIARAGRLFIVWIRDVSARRAAEAESVGRLAMLERAAEIAGVERRQIVRELAGHLAIEEVLATWVSLDHGAEQLIGKLGEAMDFAVGVLWVQRGYGLEARSSWSARPGEATEFDVSLRPLGSSRDHALPVEACPMHPLSSVGMPPCVQVCEGRWRCRR